MRTIHAADLFAGAGGATEGSYRAARRLGLRLNMVAINHWPVAVRTHSRNHPDAAHLCMSVEAVDPRLAVPGGELDLLLAGPECTHHSTARGGRPIKDQSRASAWNILRWLELLNVRRVLIENVPEFQTWGPLNAKNRPIATRKGETYRAFLRAVESLGYTVEARVLNAADYGDATTRRRLFIQARKGRGPIVWPEPTHSRAGIESLLRATAKWRGAREVIDWTLPSPSIFDRKRPLSPKTLRRIEVGLQRFGGRPFVLAQQSGGVARSTDEPLPTIATDGAISMVEPFLVEYHSEKPGETPRVRSIGEPLPTLTTENRFGLCEPFLVTMRGGEDSQVASSAQSLTEPLRTISAGGTHHGLVKVEPFLSSYYGNGSNVPVSQPVPTVTTKDRFALVIPDGVDIKFRMLQPHELASAMGFPSDYVFEGTKGDVIKQIGNAWACHTATALCEVILAGLAETEGRTRRKAVA
jgi:DNA (cytosine-5)-methyltransferase 1